MDRTCRGDDHPRTHTYSIHIVHSHAHIHTSQTHLWLPEVDTFWGHLHFPSKTSGNRNRDWVRILESRSFERVELDNFLRRCLFFNNRLLKVNYWMNEIHYASFQFRAYAELSVLKLPATSQIKAPGEHLVSTQLQGSKSLFESRCWDRVSVGRPWIMTVRPWLHSIVIQLPIKNTSFTFLLRMMFCWT